MGFLGKVVGMVIAGAVAEEVIDDINEKRKERKEEEEYFSDDYTYNSKGRFEETRLISLKCQNCNQELEMDSDHLLVYCPYCGSKLMIAMDNLDDVLVAKEKTKRLKMKYEHELAMEKERQAEERRNDKEVLLMLGGIFLFCIIASVIGL